MIADLPAETTTSLTAEKSVLSVGRLLTRPIGARPFVGWAPVEELSARTSVQPNMCADL
jgi:hypothetical protein